MKCSLCGASNRSGAHFCDACGAPLGPHREEHRKLVTALFCDVVGSTALGESVDPEALEALLHAYFERMKGIVERHGGIVEKFVGDAVVAVFGLPVVHEDDALRACRAALEMRSALPELGIEGRIGVNSGEVMTGSAERLAIGDAVNVAARLQQAAQPGEVLLGEQTLALVGAAVEAEPVEELALKGKSKPVPASRLLSVVGLARRRHDGRFVGRVDELARVRSAWRSAVGDQRCELLTIVGEAGIGKSRLVAEALEGIEARVLQAGCAPYGEGSTYGPVVEVVEQLAARPSDPAAAAALRSLLGESEDGTTADESAWAVRKLLEQEAPLIVVFDDIHWGDDTFLDLLESLARLSSGAALLLLCLARPELLDRRPHWPVGVRLAPLADAQVAQLIGPCVAAPLRQRIAHAAGGNPLFVLEMLSMIDQGADDIVVPPTLRALLAARLDQLEDAERHVVECAAVEGEAFHRRALEALAPETSQLAPQLAALVRRALIHPEPAQVPGDDSFRFRHLLIRDAAYDAIPKAIRAELHERFAGWLEQDGATAVELDELVGYHLEQAAHYKRELGRPDPALSERAAGHLATAGRRALARPDFHAAASLLERARELTPRSRLDVHLELDLAGSLRWEAPDRAAAIAEAAAERAHDAGDQAGEALARAVAAHQRTEFGVARASDEPEALARAALPLLEQAADHHGLVYVWMACAIYAQWHGRFEEVFEASEQMLRHGRLSGRSPVYPLNLRAQALVLGPRPAEEALHMLDGLLPDPPAPFQVLLRARLLAMLDRFDEAWPAAREANGQARERSGFIGDYVLAEIAHLEGDGTTAVRLLAGYCDTLEKQGRLGYLSSYGPLLGRFLCALGRYGEAEALAQRGRELGAEDDVMTQMLWRQVQAVVLAHCGDHGEAERLAREAVTIGERTDSLEWQGDALEDLAEVLEAAGRTDEAEGALAQALDRYGRKQNLALAGQVRQQLDVMRARVPSRNGR